MQSGSAPLQSTSGPDAPRARRREPTIDELVVADDPARWSALGFTVAEGCSQIGALRLRLVGRGAGNGIVSWALREVDSVELDGLPTSRSRSPVRAAAGVHPNGVVAVDHVVAMSPDLDRSVMALQAAGLRLRRIRELPTPAGAPRQAFFRLGPEILEVIQEPEVVLDERAQGTGPARFWGLALVVEDLDRAAERLGQNAGPAHDAVQRGRRIASLRRSAGLAVPVALMSARADGAGA
jgi:hypothetical protein